MQANDSKIAYENLIFQGGGVKGTAYLGCLQELYQNSNPKFAGIQRVGGASAGAITALLLALGYDFDEIKVEIEKLDFLKFLDDDKDTKDRNRNALLTILEVSKKIKNVSAFVDIVLRETLKIASDRKVDSYIKDNFNWVIRKLIPNSMVKSAINDIIDSKISSYVFSSVGPEDIEEVERVIRSVVKNYKLSFDGLFQNVYDIIYEVLKFNKGLFSGASLLTLFKSWIKVKTGKDSLTFKELNELRADSKRHIKDLYVVALRINTKYTEIFSYETTPNVLIEEAVRASMSIPVFFETAIINKKYYVDGGVLDNYPVWLFDQERYVDAKSNSRMPVKNHKTLGFKLCSPAAKKEYEANIRDRHTACNEGPDEEKPGFFKEFGAIVGAFMDKENNDHHLNGDAFRTVYVSHAGVSAVNFDLSPEKKKELVDNGIQAVKDFLGRGVYGSH